MTITATNIEGLRQGWEDAVSALAPDVAELPELLDLRLREAVPQGPLDEQSLLRIVEEAWRLAGRTLSPADAATLARRMQQTVYEFLLSLDAVVEPRVDIAVDGPPSGFTRNSLLIGAEEVADLQTQAPPEPPVVVPLAPPPAPELEREPEAEPQDAPDPVTPPQPELEPEPQPEPEPQAEPEPEPLPLPAAEITPEAAAAPEAELEPEAAAAAEPEQEPAMETPEVPAEAEPEAPPAPVVRRRFTLFRRSGEHTSLELGDDEPGEAQAAPPEQAATEFESMAAPAASTDETVDATAPPPFMAPKDGFHITDEARAAVLAGDENDELELAPLPVIERSPEPKPAPSNGKGTRAWRIRNLRPGRRQDKDEPPPADGAAENDEDEEPEFQELQPDSRFDSDPDVLDARRQINERLRQRRCDEAASLLQRLAAEPGGRDVAELALDAGDRCRALGKANAALSCYLAASRADPLHETPLLRLADICLDDKDIELAVRYLERVARLHRVRGDRKGAVRVYRKIATVAPYRDDIVSMLMHVQATGRFEDE